MELREQFPTRADVQQLEHVSFSREQIAGLLQSHSALSARGLTRGRAFAQGQEVVLWLYLQGRLQS